jgi:hypothetical protein
VIKKLYIEQKDEGTWEDRGGDGRTNLTLRIKEQATRLYLHEHDNDNRLYSNVGQQFHLSKSDLLCVILNAGIKMFR